MLCLASGFSATAWLLCPAHPPPIFLLPLLVPLLLCRYNMLLNLLRVEGANPEQMMALSFHQFQNEQAAPALEALMAEKEAEREGIEVADEPDVEQYVVSWSTTRCPLGVVDC